jgi:ABC-2 type transport system permease protein
MNAFINHLAYDFRTGIRDRAKLFMFYLFPLVFFLLVGGLMTATNPFFKAMMLPAMVIFAVMCATLLSLPNALVEAREAGVFRSYRINGVPAASIVAIPVFTILAHVAVVAVVVSVAGVAMYQGVAPASMAGFVLAALLAYAAHAGMGALVGVAAGNTTASMLAAQLIYIPSIILGGLTVPASVLPPALRRVALLLPASHAMKAFSALAMPDGAPMPWASLAALAAGTVLSFVLAALLFEWDSRRSAPSRKALLALLAAAPYAVAMFLAG